MLSGKLHMENTYFLMKKLYAVGAAKVLIQMKEDNK